MRAAGWIAAGALALAGCGTVPETAEPVASAENHPASQPSPDPTELDVEDVAARIAAGEDIFLLDVRTPEELVQDGAIDGYTHIPIDELEGRMEEVPKDKPIVAY